MVCKKSKRLVIILTFIVLTIFLANQLGYLSFVSENYGSIYQYTSINAESIITSKNLVVSNEAIIKTTKSTFKFVTKTSANDPYDQTTQSYLGRKCRYGIEVYKDGILVDSFDTPPQLEGHEFGSIGPYLNEQINKAYGDDGTVYKTRDIPEGESGVEVQFANRIGSYEECWVKNYFKLKLPENLINVEFEPIKNLYLVGETFKLNTQVENTQPINLIGNLKIIYTIPTILGDISQTQEQEVVLHPGLNILEYSIPTERQTSELLITPTLELKMSTSGYSGVNIIFNEGQQRYDYKSNFLIGTEIAETKSVIINQEEPYLNITKDCTMTDCPEGSECDVTSGLCTKDVLIGCKTNGCIEGYECNQETDVCYQIPIINTTTILLIVGGVGIVIFLIWLYLKSR